MLPGGGASQTAGLDAKSLAKAARKFAQLDVDESGALSGEELIEMADWVRRPAQLCFCPSALVPVNTYPSALAHFRSPLPEGARHEAHYRTKFRPEGVSSLQKP